MTVRTSISFSTEIIRTEVAKVAKLHYWGNASAYIQELIVKDLIERGHTREQLLENSNKRYVREI